MSEIASRRGVPIGLVDVNSWESASRWGRAMRLIAFGIIGGFAVANVVWSIQTWPMGDVVIYWEAGERIRAGEPLYPGRDAFHSFRYAPWFAWMWAGFTYLPFAVVAVVWEAALLLSTIAVALPFLRRGAPGLALAGLLVPLVFAVSAGGNVQALLLVGLIYGIDRRSGPLWIAIAASLRATPIVFVLVYVARREWGRVAATLLLTAFLVAPMFFYEPERLITDVAGREPGLLAVSPLLFVSVAILAVAVATLVALRLAPSTRIAAAAAGVLASPKLFAYDTTLMLAALDPRDRDSR
jgi:hypothetical protein